MLSDNPYGSFDECPEYKAKQSFFRLPFFIPKILEGLSHRLAKLFLKGSRIKSKELLIESMNDFLFMNHKQTSLGIVSVVARW